MTFAYHDYAVYILNLKTGYKFLYSVFKKEKQAQKAINKLLDKQNPYVVWIQPYDYFDF